MDAWIGIGANLGERCATLEAAIDALGTLPHTRLVARSRLWTGPPVDAEGPDYLNAVARLDTDLDPVTLLRALQALETRFGRVRSHRNASRTLDLDLLLSDDTILDRPADAHGPALQLPHPRLHRRGFVLGPMGDIDETRHVPGQGTVRHCLARLGDLSCRPLPPACPR